MVAEGAAYDASALQACFAERGTQTGFQHRTTILNHVEQAGAPSAHDRLLRARFGAAGVEATVEGKPGVPVGINNSRVTTTPLEQVGGIRRRLHPELLAPVGVL